MLNQMTYPTCWRCFSKSRIPFFPPIIVYPSASFTTSAPVQKPKEKATRQPEKRTSTKSRMVKFHGSTARKGEVATFVRRKKPGEARAKKSAVGERAALRKRIVLSNNNALTVENVPKFGAESIGDEQLHGRVVGLTESMVVQLRAVDAFKRTQSWGLFRNPAMLVRRETIEYGRLFNERSEEQEPRRSIRRIIVGERGSGKSIILLQAMTMAFLKGWVVINLPEAQDIVIGHTEYGPIPQTSPPLYQQKVYTASLLSAIARANPILSTLTLTAPPPPTPAPIPPSITLDKLARLGAAEPDTAYVIFEALVQDLLLPGRPPLLLCIDSLAHAMKLSAYRNAAFVPIHAHDLAILNWFMSYLSGASELPNGGMVLAATSGSNPTSNLSLDTALHELEFPQSPTTGLRQDTTAHHELNFPQSHTGGLYHETKDKEFFYTPGPRNPFIKYDQRVLDVFSRPGMEIQRLKGLSKDEARGLIEYWAKSGWVKQKVDNTLVGEKWALSGCGVVGELERATMTMKI